MVTCIPVPTTKRWLRQLFPPRSRSSGSARKQLESVFEFERLPVDIVCHIHSLLPVKDAARAACVSRGFLHSWRCYSNLTLSMITLGLTDSDKLTSVVDHILEKHSAGIGVEIFSLDIRFYNSIDTSYLDRWFQNVARLGVKELSLVTSAHMKTAEYNFTWSVFCGEVAGNSIRSLHLEGCTFHPTAALGCFRKLTRLRLRFVNITDEGLGHLLSKSPALEQMDIICCSKIISLMIPCTLQKLTILRVGSCHSLQALNINAPQLSTLECVGPLVEDISVADPWQLKDVYVYFSCYIPCNTLYLALARLPTFAPNVESLKLVSTDENFNTPMLVSQFPCLKKLEINIYSPEPAFKFDVLSLVCFLDASPALDFFILHVRKDVLRRNHSVGGGNNANSMRGTPQCQYDLLRRVMITGFHSNKNLIQLVIYIIESAPSLECLTLDTTPGNPYPRKCGIIGKSESCSWMKDSSIAEAHRAVKAVNKYITKRVPAGVRLQILEPCSRCHTRKWWHMD